MFAIWRFVCRIGRYVGQENRLLVPETTDQLPALDTLVRIADALGVSTDYLLGRTAAMDAAFTGQYVAPERAPCVDRMPKNPAELADFVRYTVAQMQKDEQPDSR